MELPGSSYLLNLGVLSITFVGFSTIAVVFRQEQGGDLSEYDILVFRLMWLTGLTVTIFSLVPPLLGLFAIAPSMVWRVSSLAFALVALWRAIRYPRLYAKAHQGSRSKTYPVLYAITIVAILGLFINTIGIFIEPGAGLYALAATWFLINAIIVFTIALPIFLRPKPS